MSKPRRAYPTPSYLQSSTANQQPVGEAPSVPLYSPTSQTAAIDQSQYYQQMQQPGYQQSQSYQQQQYQQPQYQQSQQSYQQPLNQQPQQQMYQSGYQQPTEQQQAVDGISQGVAGLGLSPQSSTVFNLQSAVPPVNELLDFPGPKIGLNVILYVQRAYFLMHDNHTND
jgi:hypothetical protein